MNRRNFFQAAALSTVAALQSRGMRLPTPARQNAAIEVNIADPKITARQVHTAADVYVELFEPAGDPGQLSGARLVISDRGQEACLSVSMGQHFMGFAESRELRRFFEVVAERVESDTAMSLREGFPDAPYGPPSDNYGPFDNLGFLILIPGAQPELRVKFGWHCFGLLRGHLAVKFLDCMRQRLAAA